MQFYSPSVHQTGVPDDVRHPGHPAAPPEANHGRSPRLQHRHLQPRVPEAGHQSPASACGPDRSQPRSRSASASATGTPLCFSTEPAPLPLDLSLSIYIYTSLSPSTSTALSFHLPLPLLQPTPPSLSLPTIHTPETNKKLLVCDTVTVFYILAQFQFGKMFIKSSNTQ